MPIFKSKILGNVKLTEDLFILKVEFFAEISAGQFVMINIPDQSKILPRPISVFDYDASSKVLSLLIRKRGEGTSILSTLKINDFIDIFGTFGKGFDTTLNNKSIILIGGGEGIAPMLLTSNLLKNNNNIKIFAGFKYIEETKILEYFSSSLDIQYTVQTCTEKKLVTELLDTAQEPDYIFTCGPIPMMKNVYNTITVKNWNTKVFVSMESHMACGVGACMGCTIRDTINNPIRICTNGPVFLAEEVFNA